MSLPSKSRPPRNVFTITVQTRLMTCQVQQPAKEGRKVHTALGKTDLRMVWRQLTLIQLQLHLVVERVTVLCRNGRLCDKAVTGCPVHLEHTAELSVVWSNSYRVPRTPGTYSRTVCCVIKQLPGAPYTWNIQQNCLLCDQTVTGCPVHLEHTAELSVVWSNSYRVPRTPGTYSRSVCGVTKLRRWQWQLQHTQQSSLKGNENYHNDKYDESIYCLQAWVQSAVQYNENNDLNFFLYLSPFFWPNTCANVCSLWEEN